MRKILSCLALLIGLPAFGQATISGVSIETNGWQVLVYTTGLNTNGTYSMGLRDFATIYAPTTNKVWQRSGQESIKVRVQSPGFIDRSAVTRYRVVTGTYRVRKPYPGETFGDERVITGGVQIRIALDFPVYAGDTIVTADILAGLYAQGGTNLPAGTGLTVTNNSTLAYHKAPTGWNWPGYNRELGPNMYLRAKGMAAFAEGGFPLAGLDFIVHDQAGTTTTNAATFGFDPVLSLIDPYRQAEWWAAIDLSVFQITNQLACNFRAYPFVGTTNEITDTRTTTWRMPHPYPCTITNLNDRTSIYSSSVAVVDPSIGSDSTGRITNGTYSSVLTNHYFSTIAGAHNAAAGTNNSLYGHNDSGGAKIYVRTATTNAFGGTTTSTTIPAAWTELIEYPGDTVAISGDTGSADLSDRVKMTGIDITSAGALIPFNNIEALWVDQASLNSAGTVPINVSSGIGLVYLTHSTVPQFAQGLGAFGGQNCRWAIIRGNNLNGFNNAVTYYVATGNYRTTTNGPAFQFKTSTVGLSADYSILMDNKLVGFGGGSDSITVGNTLVVTNGFVVANNLFEHTGTNNLSALAFISAGTTACTNGFVVHNTAVGNRLGFCYNDTGTAAVYKWCWVQNNIWEIPGFKTDNFPTGAGNSNRIGNWQLQFGVGCFGNVFPNRTVSAAAGSFPQDFGGFGTWFGGNNSTGTNALDWVQFFSDQSYQGAGVAAAGNGDYRVKSSAEYRAVQHLNPWSFVLGYDINGNPRGMSDPPGAIATTPIRGF